MEQLRHFLKVAELENFTRAAEQVELTQSSLSRSIARLEDEMATLERDFKAVEADYGQNVLHLTLASTYIRSLLNNPVVARYLSTQHAGIFAEFDGIAKAQAL